MPDRKVSGQHPASGRRRKAITLRDVADHIGLSTATVSLVLNRSPVAKAIPKETQERVRAAVAELGYRPNFLARSLRNRRTFSIGVLVPEISEGYASEVMHGVETHLRREGYFYLLASHRSKPDLLEEYFNLLHDRLVEGFIVLAAQLEKPLDLPTVVVSGHREIEGVANVIIDEHLGAQLALEHLQALGHKKIAFFRGPPWNADAPFRWQAIQEVAQQLGIEVRPELVVQTSGISYGEVFYEQGYTHAQGLLQRGVEFSALFAFNDFSAIGAIRGFLDAGLRVPEDISVVGFDDIQVAGFFNPSLTTVRQPLEQMGEMAGRVLLESLSGVKLPQRVLIKPELIVRASTGEARDRS